MHTPARARAYTKYILFTQLYNIDSSFFPIEKFFSKNSTNKDCQIIHVVIVSRKIILGASY